MADSSVIANPGAGGAAFATFADGGAVNWPYTLVAWNEGGTITEVAAATPFPVTLKAGAATIGALTANQSVNVTQWGGTATATGAGVTTAGTLRVVIASDDTVKVDGSAVTQPVSAASLPLPAGAATAAKQPALGTAGTASADVLSVQGVAGMTPVKVDGSGATQPVSGTFWQATQPVSAAALPLPAGAATEATLAAAATAAKQDAAATLTGAVTEAAPASDTASSGLNGRLQRIAQRITAFIAQIPAALGQTTKAASLSVTVASDDDLQGKLGALTETAPATDTASSGLNGRLQRVAQRLTSMIALLPGALGAGGGLKVDGSGTALPVSQSGTWTVQPGNTANTTAWKVDGSAVTQPVSGTFWQATQPVSGTFWQATQPVSGTVSITANSAVNVAQINGVTPLMGNGVSGTGVQRVTIASDSTGQVTLAAGAAVIGALTANQSVNIAQMNGVATSMGAGAVGTGVQRVTLASDDPAVATLGATSGAAVITDASGTIQQYLRGLIKQWIAGTLVLGTGANVIGGVTQSTSPWIVKQQRAATPTQASVASSATNVTILASNANRLGATVFNDSTAVLYLKLGATASATSYTVQIQANGYFEVPFNYTGIIDGFWAAANGNARVTELAA